MEPHAIPASFVGRDLFVRSCFIHVMCHMMHIYIDVDIFKQY